MTQTSEITHIDPGHTLDAARVTELADSMRTSGWDGSPIVVVDGVVALTGAHRLAAVARLNDEGIDVDVETVDLEEIAGRYGVNPTDLLGYLGDVLSDVPEGMADELVDLGWDWH